MVSHTVQNVWGFPPYVLYGQKHLCKFPKGDRGHSRAEATCKARSYEGPQSPLVSDSEDKPTFSVSESDSGMACPRCQKPMDSSGDGTDGDLRNRTLTPEFV